MGMYVIDGLFLTQRITGTQRYALEITLELDKIIKKDEIEILVPENHGTLPQYENIRVIAYGKNSGILWQQIDLLRYLKHYRKKGIFLNNVCPILYAQGVIVIHDVCYKANPQFFTSLRDRMSAMWHRLNYWRAVHSKMKIITDSEFSKSEIMKYYNISEERIQIVYCGWQHINRVNAAKDTFERFDQLIPGNYYFSMSTLGANKNFRWILYAAKNNPEEQFAIAGGGKLKGAAEAEGFADLPNIHFLGYVSDEDAKTLMANCKAFVFPTFYEGFGLTPLEAVASGAKEIFVSDTDCMREIYGQYAEYIDPNNTDTILECKQTAYNREALLSKYSWKVSAQKLKGVLDE